MNDARLSALDTAFLCMESAQAPLHLGALAVFAPAERVQPEQLTALLGDRAERLPWLRRRAHLSRLPTGAGVWVEDRLFRLRHHVHLHQLAGADQAELSALASELMAEPLDLNRPLWQLHVITGLAGGRFAVLVKLHHALADGLRAVELGVGLLDGFADLLAAAPTMVEVAASPAPLALPATPSDRAGRAPLNGLAGLAGSLLDLVNPATAVDLVKTAADLATHPDRLMAGLARTAAGLPGLARQAADLAGIASSVLSCARPVVPTSPLGAASSPHRTLALLNLDVRDVRQVRRRHGGTDNDVLLAVLAGALRAWLADRGYSADGADVRALIPVSRRSRPDEPGRGNILSAYLCDLPVREHDPLARLRKIRSTMDRNKAAGPNKGGGAVPVLADRLPAAVHRMTAPLARHGASLLFDTMVTNVPIPSRQMSLAGAPLSEVYPIAPLASGQALGIALSPYLGQVHIGLHADHRAMPDLNCLADAVPAALSSLAAAAAMP